VFFVFSVHR